MGASPAVRCPPRPGGALDDRPDCLAREKLFDLTSAAPEFDKATEDGLRFRMYKFGSLDVRTTQAHDGGEVVGAVFSVRAAAASTEGELVPRDEVITKVTEYVEAASPHYRSYVVVETARGGAVCTMKLPTGACAWEEQSEAIADRNSLAKFIRSWDCAAAKTKKSAVTIGDLEAFKQECEAAGGGNSHSARKQYAHAAYNFARGYTNRVDSGFGAKTAWHKNEKANLAKKEKHSCCKA